MAELIHNYLKGRMNKDLDERLVPNGEYRDALNIEISTSEDSNTGAVQSLKGNAKVTVLDAAYNVVGGATNFMSDTSASNATTVGSIAIEKDKKVFNFISLASDLEDGNTFTINNIDYVQKLGIKSDAITEWVSFNNVEGGNTYPLLVDVFESRIEPPGVQASLGVIEAVGSNNLTAVNLIYPNPNNSTSLIRKTPSGVRPGMRVQLMGPNGIDAYAVGDEVVVLKIIESANAANVKIITTKPSNGQLMTQALIDQGYVYRFTAPRILNFITGTSESESNVSGTPSSPSPKDTMITAINYVDDILFYTDSRNEPKRIHIKDFYSDSSGYGGTQAGDYLSFATVKYHSTYRYKWGSRPNFFREEHITTIRKSPRKAPTVKGTIFKRDPQPFTELATNQVHTYVPFVQTNVFDPNAAQVNASQFNMIEYGNSVPLVDLRPLGSTMVLEANLPLVNWQVGDSISFIGIETGAGWEGSILQDCTTDPSLTLGQFVIQIDSYDSNYLSVNDFNNPSTASIDVEFFAASVITNKKQMYLREFVSFAIRYRYKNKEYSSISPYSIPVFVPGTYSYSSLTGENRGMQNNMQSIVISNFVTPEVPDDVEYIDILFKNHGSINLNQVKKIQRGSDEWNAITPGDNLVTGKVVFDTETFGSTIPENQLVRVYDDVPRSAKAQEFIASRILYGNYKEGYDLVDAGADDVDFISDNTVVSYGKQFLESYEGNSAGTTASLSRNEMIHNAKWGNQKSTAWSHHNSFNLLGTGAGVWYQANQAVVYADTGVGVLSSSQRGPFLSEAQAMVFNGMNSLSYEDATYYFGFYKADPTVATLVATTASGGVANLMNFTGEGDDTHTVTAELFAHSKTLFTSPSPVNYTDNNPPYTAAISATEFAWVVPSVAAVDNNIFDPEGNITEDVLPNYFEPDTGANLHDGNNTGGSDGGNVVVKVRYTADQDATVSYDISATPDFEATGYHLTISAPTGGQTGGNLNSTVHQKEFILAKFNTIEVSYTMSLIKTDVNGNETTVQQNTVSTGLVDFSASNGTNSYAMPTNQAATLTGNIGLLQNEKLHVNITYDYTINNENIPAVTDIITLFDFDNTPGTSNAFVGFTASSSLVHPEVGNIKASYYKVRMASNSPSASFTTASTPTQYTSSARAFPSVKSLREYQIGIVYGDYYGRETPVLYDKNTSVTVPKNKAPLFNNLAVAIKNNPPAWADYYKFYIKELTGEYYNIPLFKAFPLDIDDPNNPGPGVAPETAHVLLAFSSSEASKIEVDDYLVLKKAHGVGGPVNLGTTSLSGNTTIVNVNGAVIDTDARFKVLEIINELDNAQQGANLVTPSGQIVYGCTVDDALGRFFVRIKATDAFDQFIGIDQTGTFASPGMRSQSEKGAVMSAVFEIEKKRNIDQDLFYEVGSAYPIKLDEKSIADYIHSDFILQVPAESMIAFSTDIAHDINRKLRTNNIRVKSVQGAKTFGSNHVLNIDPNSSDEGAGLAFIEFDIPGQNDFSSNNFGILDAVDQNGNVIPGNVVYNNIFLNATANLAGSKLNLLDAETGAIVQVEVVYSTYNGSNVIAIKPYSCRSEFYSRTFTTTLPFYNCISFANGVESDRILDVFNEDVLYTYDGGKQSGWKATIPDDGNYREVVQSNQIIFSQEYSKTFGGGFNEFIVADPTGSIVKLLNYEYGSITKLHARNSDLIALCENKVLKILAKKDAAYDIQGQSTFIASNKVLGGIIPFIGNYGCQNAESFAEEEYRIYFVDQAKGSVLRLSRDGITPISEAGMNDWFNDQLRYSQSIVGGYDPKKNAYIITLHEVTSPEVNKNVYTLGFKENVKGWTSFKSYIPESSVALSNNYYTFKNGLMYLHHVEELTTTHCNFYGTQYEATLTDIFNESPNVVKNYKAVSYEGTQSKVDAFTDVVSGGVTYNDNEFYNDTAKTGWYVESIVTDKESGEVNEFIEKEGKWHNYIKSNASASLDLSSLSVQGIDVLSDNAILTTGTLPGTQFSFSCNVVPAGPGQAWSTTPTASQITNFPGSTQITISPNSNFAISASAFNNGTLDVTVAGASVATNTIVTGVSFVDTTTPGLLSNQVIAVFDLTAAGAAALTGDVIITWTTGATATAPSVIAEHFIQFVGNFTGGGAESFTHTAHPWETGYSQTSASEILINSIPNNTATGNNFINITLTGNNFVYSPSLPPTVVFGNDIINDGELGNYNATVTVDPSGASATILIDYDPLVTNTPGTDINNVITITTNSATGVLEYGDYTPSFVTSNVASIGYQAGSYTKGVNTTSGPFTVQVTDFGSPGVIIANSASVTTNFDPNIASNNFITFDAIANNSTTLTNTATIVITSSNYPQLTDTLTITQAPSIAASLGVGVRFIPTPVGFFASYFPNLTAATYLMPHTSVFNDPSVFGELEIIYNDSSGAPPNIGTSNINFIDTGDGTSWISNHFTLTVLVHINTGNTLFRFMVDQNTASVQRSADIEVTHPTDPTVTQTVTVTQEAAPSTNSLILSFEQEDPNSSTTGVLATIGTDLEHNYLAFSNEIYANIDDFSAPSNFGGGTNGFYGTDFNNAAFNNINVTVTVPDPASVMFPVTNSYYANNSAPSFYSNDPNDIIPVQSNHWMTSSSFSSLYQPFTYIDANGTLQVTNAEYKLTYGTPAFNTWVAGDYDANDPYLCRIPIDRTAIVKGYHPFNNDTTSPNDTVTVTQKGRPVLFLEQTDIVNQTAALLTFNGIIQNSGVIIRSNCTGVPLTRVKYYNTQFDMENDLNYTLSTAAGFAWITNDPDIGGTGICNISPNQAYSCSASIQVSAPTTQQQYFARVEFAHPELYSSFADVDAAFGTSWTWMDTFPDVDHVNIVLDPMSPTLDFGLVSQLDLCHTPGTAPNVHTTPGTPIQSSFVGSFCTGSVPSCSLEFPAGSGLYYATNNTFEYNIECGSADVIYDVSSSSQHYLAIDCTYNGTGTHLVSVVNYFEDADDPTTATGPGSPPSWATHMSSSYLQANSQAPSGHAFRFQFDAQQLRNIHTTLQVDKKVVFKIEHSDVSGIFQYISIRLNFNQVI